jgi:2-polyprenyl-3-methyl-5-hydroxy-6-metoxy-1,4-benzoquinol methylase
MPDHHVCPWWLAHAFDNPLRRLVHNPENILGPYVREGMTVMDIGCGMGYFTLSLAKMVGACGRVIAVDLQQKLLDIMMKRATREGLSQRIVPHRCEPDTLGIATQVDFILAFWMIHEVPDPASLFTEIVAILKHPAKLLYAEPVFHVPENKFNKILTAAEKARLRINMGLTIRFSRAVLLESMDGHDLCTETDIQQSSSPVQKHQIRAKGLIR